MYIQFNKDISKIKNVVVLGMNWREIIIAGIGLTTALIMFFSMRKVLGADIASYAIVPVVGVVAVLLFYRKQGMNMTFEQLMFYKIKRIWLAGKHRIRHYESENIYSLIESQIEMEEKAQNAKSEAVKSKQPEKSEKAKKYAAKNSTADHTVSRHEARRNMHGHKRILHQNHTV